VVRFKIQKKRFCDNCVDIDVSFTLCSSGTHSLLLFFAKEDSARLELLRIRGALPNVHVILETEVELANCVRDKTAVFAGLDLFRNKGGDALDDIEETH
jgi:hypothetical protein